MLHKIIIKIKEEPRQAYIAFKLEQQNEEDIVLVYDSVKVENVNTKYWTFEDTVFLKKVMEEVSCFHKVTLDDLIKYTLRNASVKK
jgi:predicted transport protein